MVERQAVVIIGAGHAGLSLSYELATAGVEHLILERGRIGEAWRRRWDSFCLVSPNWALDLPGFRYDGDDPDGFLPRDEMVAYLDRYAGTFSPVIRHGVGVRSVRSAPTGGFRMETTDGDLAADTVVLATGGYQRPYRPPGSAGLPAGLLTIDADGYSNPSALPDGAVLVVGSGQTGCQLAEELNETGRRVVLACGRAPWAPRRIEGEDVLRWLFRTSFLDQTPDQLPSPAARLIANVQVTGRGGGRDLNYRTLRAAGVTLAGHFTGATDHTALFAADLASSVAFGDARYGDVRKIIQASCQERGERPPELPDPPPFDDAAPTELSLDGFGAVIFTTGFRPDFTSWVHVPGAFDEMGFPLHRDGECTAAPGLYAIGTHFLRARKSATVYGIAEDAAVVARRIGRVRPTPVDHGIGGTFPGVSCR